MNRYTLMLRLEKAYVALMMEVVGRSLVSTSQIDATVRAELAPLPQGYQIQMVVLPAGPGFVVECNGDGTVSKPKSIKARPDLSIRFKHVSHAFLVLSFQEATARAFANDRMVADGDVSNAIRLVRCLNTMEALILPKLVAQRAVKRYPAELGLGEKIAKAARIYTLVTKNLLLGK